MTDSTKPITASSFDKEFEQTYRRTLSIANIMIAVFILLFIGSTYEVYDGIDTNYIGVKANFIYLNLFLAPLIAFILFIIRKKSKNDFLTLASNSITWVAMGTSNTIEFKDIHDIAYGNSTLYFSTYHRGMLVNKEIPIYFYDIDRSTLKKYITNKCRQFKLEIK